MEQTITYFEKPGHDNTEPTLLIVKRRAQELGIKSVLIASTRGDAAVKAAQLLPDLRLIAVSHSAGWKAPNEQEFTEENRKLFEANGGKVVTMTHFFAGLNRAVRRQMNTWELNDIVSQSLKIMGEAFKVVVEITIMAADGGLVRTDEDIIACAGTNRGLDTAVVMTPVNSNSFFALKVKEILCKPRF